MVGTLQVLNNQEENKVVIDNDGNISVYTTELNSNIRINNGEVTIVFPEKIVAPSKSTILDSKDVKIEGQKNCNTVKSAGFEHREVKVDEQKTNFSLKDRFRTLHGVSVENEPYKILGLTGERNLCDSYVVLERDSDKAIKAYKYRTFSYISVNFNKEQKEFTFIDEKSVGMKFTHPCIPVEGTIVCVNDDRVYIDFNYLRVPIELKYIRAGVLPEKVVNCLRERGWLNKFYVPEIDDDNKVTRIGL